MDFALFQTLISVDSRIFFRTGEGHSGKLDRKGIAPHRQALQNEVRRGEEQRKIISKNAIQRGSGCLIQPQIALSGPARRQEIPVQHMRDY